MGEVLTVNTKESKTGPSSKTGHAACLKKLSDDALNNFFCLTRILYMYN